MKLTSKSNQQPTTNNQLLKIEMDFEITPASLRGLAVNLPTQERSRQKFLRFSLNGGADSGLLPLEQLAEVLKVRITEILPVPEMPDCVLGIYNWRGNMLWLVDLNHLVDYPPLVRQEALPTVMVVEINGQFMGLVVQAIDDIELHDVEQLQPIDVGLFPQGLLPFIQGYLPGVSGAVFDSEAIARYPRWQIHRS